MVVASTYRIQECISNRSNLYNMVPCVIPRGPQVGVEAGVSLPHGGEVGEQGAELLRRQEGRVPL